MYKKLIFHIILVVFGIRIFNVNTFAYANVNVWNYDKGYEYMVNDITNTVINHIPEKLIDKFNEHNGQIVISTLKCDKMGVAGITTGTLQDSGWYDWNNSCFIDITPTYGIELARSTILHEFGHVLDMHTQITDDKNLRALINSELDTYEVLVEETGYVLPKAKNENELFAQVFAAIVSNNDGTVYYSNDIIERCKVTSMLVNSAIGKLYTE